ncbi:hypothetical protein MMPV_001397 [Pyropia vietnamensis]
MAAAASASCRTSSILGAAPTSAPADAVEAAELPAEEHKEVATLAGEGAGEGAGGGMVVLTDDATAERMRVTCYLSANGQAPKHGVPVSAAAHWAGQEALTPDSL